jgi:hypothetical protein
LCQLLLGKPGLRPNRGLADLQGELQRRSRVCPNLPILESLVSEDLLAREAPKSQSDDDYRGMKSASRGAAVFSGDGCGIDSMTLDSSLSDVHHSLLGGARYRICGGFGAPVFKSGSVSASRGANAHPPKVELLGDALLL